MLNRADASLIYRFSINRPRPQTPLDAIKFICKDLWTLLFRKQIDNLKTNHRGVFVLTDSRFQPLSRMSVDRRAGPKAVDDALRKAQTVSLPWMGRIFRRVFRSDLSSVPLFSLRRHKRCPSRLGYGGLNYGGNDGDPIGDLSDQNERR